MNPAISSGILGMPGSVLKKQNRHFHDPPPNQLEPGRLASKGRKPYLLHTRPTRLMRGEDVRQKGNSWYSDHGRASTKAANGRDVTLGQIPGLMNNWFSRSAKQWSHRLSMKRQGVSPETIGASARRSVNNLFRLACRVDRQAILVSC